MVPRLPAKLAFLILSPLLGALSVSCGSGGSAPPPALSPTPTPNPSPNPMLPTPDLNGDWSGTLESPSFPTKVVSSRLFQIADCVDGSWTTTPPDVRWIGAISGFAIPGGLTGDMSFEMPGNGSRLCSGVGTLTGDATETEATLSWTVASYDTETCTGAFPKVATLKLRR